jgi:L-alanine-DL-glutamate epimerase-like enolase superfamily enzyme
MADRMPPANVRWFEEPVSSDDDPHGLASVRAPTSADVAAGEYGFDLVYFGRMCAARAVDCLQVDVSRCGGITELLRVASLGSLRPQSARSPREMA